MFRRMLFMALIVAAGCRSMSNDPETKDLFERAESFYKNGKFPEASKLYVMVLEKYPAHYAALLGLANACRENGNQQYMAAYDMATQRKTGQARKLFGEATENHNLALKYFEAARKTEPDDMAPHMGLGQFWYERATTSIPFPHPLEDKKFRQQDRDEAIKEFKLVVGKVPQTYLAHKYLGMALIAADKMEEALPHLQAFHDSRQKLYNYAYEKFSATTEDEKQMRDRELRKLEKEIDDVRQVMTIYRGCLQEELQGLQKSTPPFTSDQRQRKAQAERQTLVLDKVIGEFSLIRLGPQEQALRDRCIEYLRCFNRGLLQESLSFLMAMKPEEASPHQQDLAQKLERKMRLDKPEFRNIRVKEREGLVVFVCDRVADGTPARREVTTRWKLVDGLWMLAEFP